MRLLLPGGSAVDPFRVKEQTKTLDSFLLGLEFQNFDKKSRARTATGLLCKLDFDDEVGTSSDTTRRKEGSQSTPRPNSNPKAVREVISELREEQEQFATDWPATEN